MKGIPESSSLAILEKRPTQRTGGCAGIFFQLLEWNRRLAKKKLFSKKLFPPVHAVKRISKKFGGNDKMPMSKMLLIADENRGGFPSLKKPEKEAIHSSGDDGGDSMCTPNLVARLMGLELIPVANHEKPRKALDSEFYCSREEESCEYSRLDQDLCIDIGASVKIDARPQKLQKTAEFVERRPANADRFSSDVFHLRKNVRSGSRKQHHKLPSPLKSPRLSRRSTARLMEAATKILEPGLQSRNRSRGALTFMGSLPTEDDGYKQSPEQALKESVARACRSWGSVVEVSESKLGGKEPLLTKCSSPPALDINNASSLNDGSERVKMQSSIMPTVPSRTTSLAVQANVNVRSKASDFMERKNSTPRDQSQSKYRHNGSLKSSPKLNDSRQNQLQMVRDKTVPGSKVSSRQQYRRTSNNLSDGKDFVRMNRSLNSHHHIRSLDRVPAGHTKHPERNGSEKNMVRKRRPITGSQMDNVGVNSTVANPRSAGSCLINRKGTELSSGRSINSNRVRSELQSKTIGVSCNDKKDNGIISFTFSSPVKCGPSSLAPEAMGKKISSKGKSTCGATHAQSLVSDVKSGNLSFPREMVLEGDTLSKILEQKIRQLASLDQVESAPGISNASILEELISALTAGSPISPKNTASRSVDSILASEPYFFSEGVLSQEHMSAINRKSEGESETCFSSSFVACENDQPSPVSILEASFSNDSSFSGSLNGSSGFKPPFELAKNFGTKAQLLDLDVDLLDSANSINLRKADVENSPCSIAESSSMKTNWKHEIGLLRSKSTKGRHAFSNIELLFEQISIYESDGQHCCSMESLLLDILEGLIEASSSSSDFCLGFKDAKQGNQLRAFLLDCMMECLDLNYSQFFKNGYIAWSRLPVFLSTESLIREVQEGIRGWRDLAGRSLDELVEMELSNSTRKWKEFEVEAFVTGTEIGGEILQILVDEIVKDLSS